MSRMYQCRACGATWVSYPAGAEIERAGRCLRCEGDMVLVASPEEHPRPPGDPPDATPPAQGPRDFEAEARETDDRR